MKCECSMVEQWVCAAGSNVFSLLGRHAGSVRSQESAPAKFPFELGLGEAGSGWCWISSWRARTMTIRPPIGAVLC
jgi:hypothetical protein